MSKTKQLKTNEIFQLAHNEDIDGLYKIMELKPYLLLEENENYLNLFQYCCEQGNLLFVTQLLIFAPSLIDCLTDSGENPLMLSLHKQENIVVTKFLFNSIKNREDYMKQITVDGYKALHIACKYNNYEGCSFLIENGATVYARHKPKLRAPLHIAVKYNNRKITRLLLRKYAKIDQNDHHGKTPLDYAIDNKNVRIIHKILRYSNDEIRKEISKYASNLKRCIDLFIDNEYESGIKLCIEQGYLTNKKVIKEAIKKAIKTDKINVVNVLIDNIKNPGQFIDDALNNQEILLLILEKLNEKDNKKFFKSHFNDLCGKEFIEIIKYGCVNYYIYQNIVEEYIQNEIQDGVKNGIQNNKTEIANILLKYGENYKKEKYFKLAKKHKNPYFMLTFIECQDKEHQQKTFLNDYLLFYIEEYKNGFEIIIEYGIKKTLFDVDALIYVCYDSDNVDILKQFLSYPEYAKTINYLDENRQTPIMYAIVKKHINISLYLLEKSNTHDIELNMMDMIYKSGNTILHLAIKKFPNDFSIIQKIVDYPSFKDLLYKLNKDNQQAADLTNDEQILFLLLGHYDTDELINYYKHIFDQEFKNKKEKYDDFIQLRLKYKNKDGDTIYHILAKDDIYCLELVLKNYQNCDQFLLEKNSNGLTPLFVAIQNNAVHNVDLLLNYKRYQWNSVVEEKSGNDTLAFALNHDIQLCKHGDKNHSILKIIVEKDEEGNGFPHARAIDILKESSKENEIDKELIKEYIEIFEQYFEGNEFKKLQPIKSSINF